MFKKNSVNLFVPHGILLFLWNPSWTAEKYVNDAAILDRARLHGERKIKWGACVFYLFKKLNDVHISKPISMVHYLILIQCVNAASTSLTITTRVTIGCFDVVYTTWAWLPIRLCVRRTLKLSQ